MSKPWMIYGATGYSGRLIAERAVSLGLSPTLAGRDETKLRALAEPLRLRWRAFGLGDDKAVAAGIEGMALVLNCAGPFAQTSESLVNACLGARVHYLDITGEITVFEAIFARSEEASSAGVLLLPGVGFDVVPSDCLAARLAEALPGAKHLDLAFAAFGKISPGTAKTAVHHLESGNVVRRDGKIVSVPMGKLQTLAAFSIKPRTVTSIPWGDVSTAYHSTGIPNITTYTMLPKSAASFSTILRLAGPLLRTPAFKSLINRLIDKMVPGPTEAERRLGRVYLWGKVRNETGKAVEATLDVPDGYEFTAIAALECAQRVLQGVSRTGAATPSQVFGSDFVESLPGVGKLVLRAVDPT